MSARQYNIDVTTRHQVFLQRFAGGESRKAKMALNRLRRDINARLAQEPTEFQRNRLTAVLDDINLLYTELGRKIADQMRVATSGLVVQEADFALGTANKISTAEFILPSADVLVAAVAASKMATNSVMNKKTIDDAIKQFAGKKAKQVETLISDGLVLGDTTQQIQRKVSALTGTLQRRELDTVVRTAINHAAAVGRQEAYARNSDIIDGYIWIATLDNKTCLYCGGRDQQQFDGLAGQFPTAHFNCRCTFVSNIKPEYQIPGFKGERPSIGADGVERVSSNKSYGAWLKEQPVEFIDEALGVEKSRLFRSGQISMDKFADPTGRIYTIEQLKAMNGIATIES